MQYQNEIFYHEAIWYYLLSKKELYNSSKNKITILNNGKINPYGGPDLKNICIIYNEKLVIGDAEIDKFSSNWYLHKHHINKSFSNVILHIVFQIDRKTDLNTIEIDPNSLNQSTKIKKEYLLNPIELEKFSLLRLKRKSLELQEYLYNGLRFIWTFSLNELVKSLLKKRTRPKTEIILKNLFKSRFELDHYIFLLQILNSNTKPNAQELIEFYINCSSYFTKEIYINCFLPVLLCLFPNFSNAIFTTWWSLRSSNKYSYLKNRFPQFNQEFVWQQQGMIEFLRSNNESKNLIK
jgi:hypothetical protein